MFMLKWMSKINVYPQDLTANVPVVNFSNSLYIEEVVKPVIIFSKDLDERFLDNFKR